MERFDGKYLSLTSFKRDGTGVPTPVWFAGDDGHLLVETDAPYLTPMPHRGRPNQPAYVPLVGAAVAAVRGVNVSRIADDTQANARVAFRFPSP